MKKFQNKRILLAMTSDSGFYKSFSTNLLAIGFEINILTNPKEFKYKSIHHKIISFFMRNIFNNKTYKKKLKAKYLETYQLKKIDEIQGKEDFFLTIRPDVFSAKVLDKAISKSKKAYAYQWDGLGRFPKVADLIKKFDKFYLFDKRDVKFPNTSYLTNFYFDCYNEILKSSQIKQDVYYIGCYDNRINDIIDVCSNLYKQGLSMKIIIPCSKRKQKLLSEYPFFSFPEEEITYFDNLKNVFESKIILDFGHNDSHSGLSFRPFEAIGYGKKLITTNKLIKDFDFYEESNFHVIDNNQNNDKLITFLSAEQKQINQHIKEKYGFTNWISYVLEESDYTPI